MSNSRWDECNEIEIIDGHNPSSYFWIMPVKILDYSDTNGLDTVDEMSSLEISIEEDDVAQYLTPFLYEYFDESIEPNKKRIDCVVDDDLDSTIYVQGFEWYLTHNYYTFDSFRNILRDIADTVEALSKGIETDYTIELSVKRGRANRLIVYARGWTPEEIKEYNDNRPTVDDTPKERLIDFFDRFIQKMENMIKEGEDSGYEFISVMGP